MKTFRLIFTIYFVFAFHLIVAAQSGPDGGWIRVQSDDGEFSIEVPENFSYFFDSEGFITGSDQKDYPVREMNLLNAYNDGTLLSVEIYRASSDAMKELLKYAVERGVRTNKTAFRGIEVRELIRTEDKTLTPGAKFYFVSRYFHSKEHVYIVTGLSRNGETPHMIRFFESLKFTPDSRAALAGVRRLSELKVSPVDIKYADVPPATDKSPTSAKPAPPDPDYRPVLLPSKPRASYVQRARDNNVMGAVRLRIVFGENGYIPTIHVMRTLPDGLVRQSIFAALRLKFVPAERNGKPIRTVRTLEYTFSIY